MLCRHKTERPWTRYWIPSMLQRSTSVSYIKEGDIFEGYNTQSVNVSDPPAIQNHNPGRVESIEICFFWKQMSKTKHNQGQETFLHLVFSALVPHFTTWQLKSSMAPVTEVVLIIYIFTIFTMFSWQVVGILTHQVILTCSVKRAGTRLAE